MKQSAGILVYRQKNNKVEVLLAHTAGPFWEKKDVWTIPKGEYEADEDPQTAAQREFEEELGVAPPSGSLIELGESKQPGKVNYVWAIEGDLDLSSFRFESMFTMEWPPKSGQKQQFPEVDKAKWFDLATAKTKLFKAQVVFIDRLADKLGVELDSAQGSSSQQTSLL